jgi:hypothetical protein
MEKIRNEDHAKKLTELILSAIQNEKLSKDEIVELVERFRPVQRLKMDVKGGDQKIGIAFKEKFGVGL